jgi:hypothetical protein
MVDFIDDHRNEYGVEPICEVLPIAPSAYYEHDARRRNPELRPERAKRDERLKSAVRRVWDENFAGTARRRSGASSGERVKSSLDALSSG